MFSEKEKAYIESQKLARIATVSTGSQPDVAPVGYEFDGEAFYVGGLNMVQTMKYKNVLINPQTAFVVDDLASMDPWTPRGIKVHGQASIVERKGQFVTGPHIRLVPERHWSWGVDQPAFVDGEYVMKKVRWE